MPTLLLETQRLEIRLFTPGQLAGWLDDPPRLERPLRAAYRAEPPAGAFRTIVAQQAAAADPDAPQWHSFWF